MAKLSCTKLFPGNSGYLDGMLLQMWMLIIIFQLVISHLVTCLEITTFVELISQIVLTKLWWGSVINYHKVQISSLTTILHMWELTVCLFVKWKLYPKLKVKRMRDRERGRESNINHHFNFIHTTWILYCRVYIAFSFEP